MGKKPGIIQRLIGNKKQTKQKSKDMVPINQKQQKPVKQNQIKIDPENPMSMIAYMLQSGNFDQIKEFMDLRDRVEKERAKKAYFTALSKFQAECPIIEKRKRGWNNNYKYAPYEDIISQIKEKMVEHGFSYTTNQKQTEKVIEMTGYLHHIEGHTESATLSAPWDDSGGKNAIQSIGSTETYLRRYILLDLTGIGTADSDDDGKNYRIDKNEDTKENRELYMFAIAGILKGELFTDKERQHFKDAILNSEIKTLKQYIKIYQNCIKERDKRKIEINNKFNQEKNKHISELKKNTGDPNYEGAY